MMRTRTLFYVTWWYIRDYAIFKNRAFFSILMMAPIYFLYFFRVKNKSFDLLMKTDRFCSTILSRSLIKRAIDDIVDHSISVVLEAKSDSSVLEERSIVLKDPVFNDSSVVEKGVFLIKFTPSFGDAFRAIDLPRLQKWFHVVLEPSWAGYCLPEILSWASLQDEVIVQSSDVDDRNLLSAIDTNLVPVSFGSSDWVDPKVFCELESEEKIYDVVYVANFNSIKRIYVFVNILKSLKSDGINLSAALVCASWGDSKVEVMDYIDSSGVLSDIKIYQDVSQETLNVILNQSKVNILLSLKEGSNRSLFEGFFANTPGIVLEENVGVNKSYFNSQTGMCVKEKELSKALVHFSECWFMYKPRSWALKNISPSRTVEKLASALLKSEPKATFISPISPKVNSPEVKLVEAVVKPSFSAQDILEKFGR